MDVGIFSKLVCFWGCLFVHSVSAGQDGGNQTSLIVTTIIEVPYVMMKRTPDNGPPLTGNDRFEGFVVDLVAEVAKIVGINYQLQLVQDGRYGAWSDDGTWNGMIGELTRREADMAAAPLTITSHRARVVEFTKPYMSLGLGVLLKRTSRQFAYEPMKMFLAPFTVSVWLSIVLCFVLVSLLFFVFTRFLPSAKSAAGEDKLRKERAGKTLPSCLDSFWWTGQSLFIQGWSGSRSPTSIPVRILAFFWFVFVLVCIVLYLVALNNIYPSYSNPARPAQPIQNIEDLSRQTEIKYGAVAGGSTMAFFKETRIPTFQRMWSFMEQAEPSVFVKTGAEGVDRVRRGGYAFIAESTFLDYQTNRECDLETIGTMFASRGYGLAMPLNSPFKDQLNLAILQLREAGTLHMLQQKWWRPGLCLGTEETRQDDSCKHQMAARTTDMELFSGALILMAVGVVVAALAAAVELAVGRLKGTNEAAGKRFSSSSEQDI